MTEALGGFWTSTAGVEPTFIPLEDFMAKQFMEDPTSYVAVDDLVLEDAFDAADAD